MTRIIVIKEAVCVNGEIILEKGDKIRMVETYTWEDIVDLAKKNHMAKEVVGFINFINKNQEKYKDDIQSFVDWWNDEASMLNIDDLEDTIKNNPPEDTGFENLPSNDWSYFKKLA